MSVIYAEIINCCAADFRGEAEKLWRRLQNACLGDESTIVRLLNYERRRAPSASQCEILRTALWRLRRDQGLS
jgi:hypothetical protein